MAGNEKHTWKALVGVVHAGRAYQPGEEFRASEDAVRVAVARGLVERAPANRPPAKRARTKK